MRKMKLMIGIAAVALVAGTTIWIQDSQASDTALPQQIAQDLGDMQLGVLPPDDFTLATVRGEVITTADVRDRFDRLPDQFRQWPLQLIFPQLLDEMVHEKVLFHSAKAAGVDESEEVKLQMEDIRKQVVIDVFLDQKAKEALTDEALQAAYEDFLAQNPPQEEVSAQHILVESEEEALDLLQKLNDGADFVSLVAEHSQDTASGPEGDLGYFTAEVMVESFSQAAFALEAGQISEPVQSQYGWHIIKVNDRREQVVPAFEEIKDNLRQELLSSQINKIIDAETEAADVQRFEYQGE